jgi:hypothetical protein
MRNAILVIGFCIVIFAGAWIIASMMELSNKPVIIERSQPVIMPPQTVVINDYESQIKSLQAEVTTLQNEALTAKQDYQRQYQQELIRTYYDDYYYNDYYVDRHSTSDEHDLTVVVKDDSGDPIEGAEVELTDGVSKDRETDEDGEVQFNNLDDDCYDLDVSASGFGSESREVCIDGDDRKVTVRMD